MATISKSVSGQLHVKSGASKNPVWYLFLGLSVIVTCAALFGEGVQLAERLKTLCMFFPCTIIAIALVFGRRYLMLDSNNSIMYTWWGVFGIGIKETHDIDGCDLVHLKAEVRRSGQHSETYYVASVRNSSKGSHGINSLIELQDLTEARRVAESVAEFLNLSMSDSTSGQEVTRAAGTLNSSIRELILSKGKKPEFQALADKSRLTHQTDGLTHTIKLPCPPACYIGIFSNIALAMIMALAPGIALFLLHSARSISPSIRMGGSGITILIFLIGLFVLISNIWEGFKGFETIVISPDKLVIVKQGMVKNYTQEMLTNEIEEFIVRGKLEGVTVKSDLKSISFARGLSEKEHSWLKNTIEYVICSHQEAFFFSD